MGYRNQFLIIKLFYAEVWKLHEILEIVIPVTGDNNVIRTYIQFLFDYLQ